MAVCDAAASAVATSSEGRARTWGQKEEDGGSNDGEGLGLWPPEVTGPRLRPPHLRGAEDGAAPRQHDVVGDEGGRARGSRSRCSRRLACLARRQGRGVVLPQVKEAHAHLW